MKPKLRIVIGGLAIGGAERHLSYILPILVQRGYDITVLTLSTRDTLAPFLQQHGIKVCLPSGNFFKNWPRGLRQLCQIAASVRRLYCDFRRDPQAITHLFLPEAYIITMMTALLIGHSGALVMSRRSLNHYQRKYPLNHQIEKFLHKHADFILANSRGVMHELQNNEGVPANKLGLIYNGIGIHPTVLSSTKQALRHTLGITANTLILIIVANLIPYKGHSDLIHALALIKDQLPSDWQLLVVGHDSQNIQPQLHSLAKKLTIDQHIQWLDSRADIRDLLSIADIGIIASHEEGFSNALLEAMSTPLAMVVTKVGGNPEAVLDSQSGLVVEVHNPAAMAKAILKLALNDNLRHDLASNARQRVLQYFTLPACVDRYEQVYQALDQQILPCRSGDLEINQV